MKQKIDIHDSDIQLIEEQILDTFDNFGCDYTQFGCLLELRKKMINRRALGHQEILLPDIIAFNDALTNALKKMYDKAHRIWNDLNSHSYCGDEAKLTARCYLSYDYPELHPIQGERRDELWGALCDSGWNPLYEEGVTLSELRLPSDIDGSFDALIGMDCPPPNWNEGLDPELTKDLHLTIAFHHLFDHTNFAITDFIYTRNFETEIKIEINSKG